MVSFLRRPEHDRPGVKDKGTFSGTDWSTLDNALRLAETIKQYWKARGKDYEVQIERMGGAQAQHGTKPTYGIRSNIKFSFARAGTRNGSDDQERAPAAGVPVREHGQVRP